MKNSKERDMQKAQVKWFRDKYPECRRQLIMINNEIDVSKNAIRAVNAKRLEGFVDGASDLLYVGHGRVVWIENKIHGTRHSAEKLERQILFQEQMASIGHETYFCFSLDQFISIIDKGIGMTTDVFRASIDLSKKSVLL